MHSSMTSQSSSNDDGEDEENRRQLPPLPRILVTAAASWCPAWRSWRREAGWVEVIGKPDERRDCQQLSSCPGLGRTKCRILANDMPSHCWRQRRRAPRRWRDCEKRKSLFRFYSVSGRSRPRCSFLTTRGSIQHPALSGSMRLVRPLVYSFVRAGRRSQAERVARGVPGKTAAASVGERQVGCCSGTSRSITWKPAARPTLSPCLANVPKSGPLQAYAKLVLEGKIREDRHQVKTLHLLQKVRLVLQQSPLPLWEPNIFEFRFISHVI